MPPPLGDGHPLSVLIVDDHADAAESLAELLRLAGHRATVTASGPDALDAAEQESPDVVLLELRLRGMDGWAVARRFRARGCPARLIALTTCGLPDERRRSRDVGIERHFIKPVPPGVLLSVLAENHSGSEQTPVRSEPALTPPGS